jgi:hypothetical protein
LSIIATRLNRVSPREPPPLPRTSLRSRCVRPSAPARAPSFRWAMVQWVVALWIVALRFQGPRRSLDPSARLAAGSASRLLSQGYCYGGSNCWTAVGLSCGREPAMLIDTTRDFVSHAICANRVDRSHPRCDHSQLENYGVVILFRHA